jgi:hypothetical protein
LSLVFLVSSLYLLWWGHGKGVFAAAIAAGILATFCQANGLLIWPLGLLMLLSTMRAHPSRNVGRAVVWTVVGAVTLVLFFYDYQPVANHPSPRYVIRHPGEAIAYVLAIAGGSLAPDLRGATAAGLVVLALEAVVGLVVLREWWRDRRSPPFGLWLIGLATATVMMVTLNRAGFGVEQALESRYSAYSCLGPIGLYWCVCVRRHRWRPARTLAIVLTTMMMMGWLSGTVDGWIAGPHLRHRGVLHAYLLHSAKYQPDSALRQLYVDTNHARTYAAKLERLGLNVFAEDRVKPDGLVLTFQETPYVVDLVNGRPAKGVTSVEVADPAALVSVDGWALDVSRRVPAATVFLNIDGTLDLPAFIGIDRPDVAAMSRSRANRRAGFHGSFAAALLAPGPHKVALKIVAADRRHAFVTKPIFEIVRR